MSETPEDNMDKSIEECTVCSTVYEENNEFSVFKVLPFSHQTVKTKFKEMIAPYQMPTNSHNLCTDCYLKFEHLEETQAAVAQAENKILEVYHTGKIKRKSFKNAESKRRKLEDKSQISMQGASGSVKVTEENISKQPVSAHFKATTSC